MVRRSLSGPRRRSWRGYAHGTRGTAGNAALWAGGPGGGTHRATSFPIAARPETRRRAIATGRASASVIPRRAEISAATPIGRGCGRRGSAAGAGERVSVEPAKGGSSGHAVEVQNGFGFDLDQKVGQAQKGECLALDVILGLPVNNCSNQSVFVSTPPRVRERHQAYAWWPGLSTALGLGAVFICGVARLHAAPRARGFSKLGIGLFQHRVYLAVFGFGLSFQAALLALCPSFGIFLHTILGGATVNPCPPPQSGPGPWPVPWYAPVRRHRRALGRYWSVPADSRSLLFARSLYWSA